MAVWATSDLPRRLPLKGALIAMTWAGRVVGKVPLRASLRSMRRLRAGGSGL